MSTGTSAQLRARATLRTVHGPELRVALPPQKVEDNARFSDVVNLQRQLAGTEPDLSSAVALAKVTMLPIIPRYHIVPTSFSPYFSGPAESISFNYTNY